MKTRGLVAVLLFLTGLQSALAQKFTVYMANKQVVKFSVTEVDSIVFSELDDWVDLGLPSGTLWATCNLGASSPEEYGDYFAWGETEPKSYYDFRNYKHCDGHQNTLTKYCPQEQYGNNRFTDSLTELLPEDDAATMNLGIEWQMPSSEQYEELINNNYTTITWTTLNNVYGCKITSKSNGNSIFMPAGGRYEGESLDGVGVHGDYWSRSLYTLVSYKAYMYLFDKGKASASFVSRASGRNIRPIRVKKVQAITVSNIELSQTELSVKVGETTQLSATVLPDNATNQNLKWESSNADVATVDETGKVVAVAVGTCTITCSATDGSGVKAECIVTVMNPDNSGTLDGHEYVDLGLPSGTLWATCNVGASKPEEYGDYFAWGETQPKSEYSLSTYKYCKGERKTLTKYCMYYAAGYKGFTDTLTELLPEDDAATVNLGNDWQTPSEEQIAELIDNRYTTTTWSTYEGISGLLVTSISNGNSIFLPAGGKQTSSYLNGNGTDGCYWSRTVEAGESANHLIFTSEDFFVIGYDRENGMCIRPVRAQQGQVEQVEFIELSQTELVLNPNDSRLITAAVLPKSATNKSARWESSDEAIATVDEIGEVTAVAVGTCTITCSATDGSGVKAECIVTVTNPDNSGTLDGHEYVDLGLPSGTLWATCNVGANSPEEYGDYYAWAETEPKSDYYWETYKYCKGSYGTMTKYCINSDSGTVDNKTELEPSDDAATANWGSGWQMPSEEQYDELYNSSYTTTTWTTMNGKYGRKITSKCNGNSIFLPAAGYRNGTSLRDAGSYGYYWSRSLSTSDSGRACGLYFYSSYISTGSSGRSSGQSVRPVRVR